MISVRLPLYSTLSVLIGISCSLSLPAQEADWFSDQTTAVGLQGENGFRIYVADIDNDDYPDVLLENGLFGRNQLTLYLNRQAEASQDPLEREFVDVTEQSGINANRNPEEDGRQAELAVMADLDNDGDMDMITGCYYHRLENYTDLGDRSEVLLNDGTGTFNIVANSGLPELGLINVSGLAMLDYDLDGILDLYIATWSRDHTFGDFMEDFLMKGNGDGTFSDVTTAAGLRNVRFPMYGVNVTDWNNDGWPDIITSPYCRSGGSVWRNNGDGTFTDVASQVGYNARQMSGDNGQTMCQWESLPADFDNDGDMDLALMFVHGGLDPGEGRSTLAVNSGAADGYRLDWELDRLPRKKPHSTHLGDQDAMWFDMENDGLLDLVISQSVYQPGTDRMYIFQQGEDHYFTDVTGALGLVQPIKGTHAMEPLDYDLDGDDDLLVAKWRPNDFEPEQKDDLVLLRNEVGQDNFWLAVKLIAPEGVNANAIGARIAVHTGSRTQIRELQAGRGHFGGQQPFIRTFGLGLRSVVDTVIIDSVVVRWPAYPARHTVVYAPPVNTRLTVDGRLSVAVRETPVQEEALFYPNPAAERITLVLPEAEQGFRHRLELVDALGMRHAVIQPKAGSRVQILSLRHLPNGRYFLRQHSTAGTRNLGSFIKQQ